MLTEHKTLDELAGEIATALGDLDPAGQRLAIALYRLLAAGHAVAVADLATAAGLPESEVAATLDGWPAVFTDSQGRITGFWGLAITELSSAHRYESGGKVLYAWCAWDTLFLPARLGQAARVTSACPLTGEPITLTVTPEGISGTSHPQAVVSFLMPGEPFDSGRGEMRSAGRLAGVTLRPWQRGRTAGAGPGPIRTCCSRSFALRMMRCG
jgi:hypothetical protein